MKTPSLETAIQSLPPELREMILKRVISAKGKDRAEMGWDAVHAELATVDTQKKIRCELCADRLPLSREVQAPKALSDICSDCWSGFQELEATDQEPAAGQGNAEEDPRWPSWL